MGRNKLFIINLIILLLLPAVSVATVPFVSDHSNFSYTQAQIDSLVTVEVRRQIDTQLIGLKIDKAASDKLGKYIEEENNHLSFLSILVTAISVLMAIVALVVPFFINKQRERIINEKLKDYKESVDQYVKESKEKVSQFVEERLQNVNESLSRQADFSISLTRALTNENDDIKLNLLEEIIKDYADDSFVSFAYNCRGNVYLSKKNTNLPCRTIQKP